MQINSIFKEFENLSVEKKTFAVDRQSKDLGWNTSAVESVFFSTERFSNSLNISIKFKNIYDNGNNLDFLN